MRVQGRGLRVEGRGSRVQGSEFRVESHESAGGAACSGSRNSASGNSLTRWPATSTSCRRLFPRANASAHLPASSCRTLNLIEHRGGFEAQKPSRLCPVSESRGRFPRRDRIAVAVGSRYRHGDGGTGRPPARGCRPPGSHAGSAPNQGRSGPRALSSLKDRSEGQADSRPSPLDRLPPNRARPSTVSRRRPSPAL